MVSTILRCLDLLLGINAKLPTIILLLLGTAVQKVWLSGLKFPIDVHFISTYLTPCTFIHLTFVVSKIIPVVVSHLSIPCLTVCS